MIDSNSPVRFKLASWSIFEGPWKLFTLDNAIKQSLFITAIDDQWCNMLTQLFLSSTTTCHGASYRSQKFRVVPPYKIRTRDVKSNGSSASLLYIFFTQIKGARISKRNAYDTNAVMAYYKKNVFEGELT